MNVTMTIKDAELSCDNGTLSEGADEEGGDENLMMMQRQWAQNDHDRKDLANLVFSSTPDLRVSTAKAPDQERGP